MRFIGPSEACWGVFRFYITERKPRFQTLQVPRENELQVVFNTNSKREEIQQTLEGAKRKQLSHVFLSKWEWEKWKWHCFTIDLWGIPRKVYLVQKQEKENGYWEKTALKLIEWFPCLQRQMCIICVCHWQEWDSQQTLKNWGHLITSFTSQTKQRALPE